MMSNESAEWNTGTDEAYWQALLNDESLQEASPDVHLEDSEEVESVPIQAQQVDQSATGSAPDSSLRTDWQTALGSLRSGDVLELEVVDFNRGGLLVGLGCLSGFVPCSQLSGMPRFHSADQRLRTLRDRVGQTLSLRVIEADYETSRLILSEIAVCGERPADDLLARLEPGDVCSGQVMQVRPFGAFVDLGGIEGLVHISELSWGWVSHPEDVLSPGEEVEVYVIGVHPEERRVALSLKRLRADPWTLVDDRYSVGELVQGQITNVVNFGAFMQLEEGLEGLIHISELANGSFMHPRMVVQEGAMVTARVLDIDSANRRLALSLRQVAQWDQRVGPPADTEVGSLNGDANPSPYGNEERLP